MPQGKRMAAVSIGVSDAKPLDYLGGASQSARDFHQWSTAAGYESTLITDDEEVPLTFPRLRAEFEKVLAPNAEPIHRLVIYFAGHGLIREAEEGLWLLSDWGSELRAVAVEVLKRRLYRYGLSQICIIADACRLLPTKIDAADLTADGVLGRGPKLSPVPPAIDKFIAAQDGAATFIVPGPTPEDDRCLFSRVLLEGLWGANPSAYSTLLAGKITSRSLAAYLQSQVPARAAQYGFNVVPTVSPTFPEGDDVYLSDGVLPPPPNFPPWPEPKAQSRGILVRRPPPSRSPLKSLALSLVVFGFAALLSVNYLLLRHHAVPNSVDSPPQFPPGDTIAAHPRPHTAPLLYGILAIAAVMAIYFGARRRRESSLGDVLHPEIVEVGLRTVESEVLPIADRLRPQRAPKTFDTGSGLAVDGAKVSAIWTRDGVTVEPIGQESEWLIHEREVRPPQSPLPFLVEFEGGSWAAATALPHSAATLVVDERGIVGLVYRSVDGYRDAVDPAIDAISRMQSGSLRAVDAPRLLIEFENSAHADPVLGVIAAYLFDSLEDVASIRRIAAKFFRSCQFIPYDIALLAQLKGEWRGGLIWTTGEAGSECAQVAGLWPWMRQGWGYLDDPTDQESSLITKGLAELREYLLPARFATFKSIGGQRLRDLFLLTERHPLHRSTLTT